MQTKFQNSGVYQLIRPNCTEIYQTGKQFKIRYKEHLLAIKNNKMSSAFARHLLNNRDTMGHIEDINNKNTVKKTKSPVY